MLGSHWPARIHVVGTCGAGKTTLARSLAQALGYTHVELDALNWDPHWTQVSDAEFLQRVRARIPADRWIIDGNYSRARAPMWAQRPAVVWLDYEFDVVMRRLVARTVRRMVHREVLWSGNRERIRTTLASRDSILWWGLTTFHRRRREYPEIFAAHPHVHVLRLGHPDEADALVEQARAVVPETLDAAAADG